jgi:dihydroorotase
MLDSGSMKAGEGLLMKVNPPLRDKRDVSLLREQLSRGMIDVLETDHAPHTLEEKKAPPYCSGMPELDTFSGFISRVNSDFGIPWGQIVSMTSRNASRIFGLGSRDMKAGGPATLTLLDMEPAVVRRESLKTKCGWSPYEGMTFPGSCKATIIGGNVAYLREHTG